MAVYYALLGRDASSTNTGAYCRARAKVTEGVVRRLVEGVAERCETLFSEHVRKDEWHCVESRSCRASSAVSTSVRPTVTTCFGLRTEAAGFTGRICPVTSQSNSIFNAASFCFTLGRSTFVAISSTYAATRNGLMSRRPMSRSSHQSQKSRTARP